MNALNAYICLNVYGSVFFGDYIDHVNDLTADFAALIKNHNNLELATDPQCNIICYRYIADNLSEEETDMLNYSIRKALLEDGKFYIVQTQLNGNWYLRNTIINPLTSKEDLEDLVAEIENIATRLQN